MARVQLVGPLPALDRALRVLQGAGVLDLAPVCPAGARSAWLAASPGGGGREERGEALLARVDALLARLPPATAPAEAAPEAEVDLDALAASLARTEEALAALEARAADLGRERDVVERHARALAALAPLAPELPRGYDAHVVALVVRDDADALAALEAEVGRIARGAYFLASAAIDAELRGLLVVVPRQAASKLSALLAERGSDEVSLPAECRDLSLPRAITALLARRREVLAAVADLERGRAPLAEACAPLRRAAAGLRDELARLHALCDVAQSAHAFVVAGWAPQRDLAGLEATVRGALGEGVTLTSRPAEPSDEDVPVLLANGPLTRPFERLLTLVPPPRYGSVDPTPWIAFSFPLFFGLVLGDVAFGLLGLGVAALALRRGWGGLLGRDLAVIALACSASALVFGVLFGEAFGGLGEHVGLHPLVFDRRTSLFTLLVVAVAVGLGHVLVGLVLGIVAAARGRHPRKAIARAATAGLLAAGAAALAAATGRLPVPVLAPLAAAGVLAAAALIAEGPMALLEAVSAFGNVMSYARLMALGLATAMLADVANRLGAAVDPPAAGLALAVFLHAVNFTIGLVSPAIAALRLQLVEFLEKFYEEGGRKFRPFAHVK
jgi:V/A-type H+-transporting ATPase subunit I